MANPKKQTKAERRASVAVSPAVAARALASAAIGADVRRIRQEVGVSQQRLADEFKWGRDAMSKLETGENDFYLYDYLKIVAFCRDIVSDHPGLLLHDMLFSRKG